ncbi:MAG: ABC transporter permease, partial [Candidatus Acidiferrum sp.]
MPLDADSTRHGRLTFSLSGPVIGLIGVLAVFCLILAIQGDLGHFVQLSNLQTLLNRNSVNAAVALGMLLIIISGGIDLSSGSVVALVTVVAMQAYRHVEASTNSPGLASALAILSGIGTGALCGLVNGLVITQLRVLPFVATLGMYSVARGLAFWLAGRTRISFRGQRPGWIEALSQARSDYLFDPGVWIVAAIAIAVAILLRNTVFGRYCSAIGSNEETARLCGVSVNRQKILIYTLAGLLTGLAGILVFAHT